MRLFSRNKEATAPTAADVPFETLRRVPRKSGKAGRPRTLADPAADPTAPLDPADAARTRARRRLIGAVALALAAIVFVPMLFDRTPGPNGDDIAVQIPDRDAPFEGRRGVSDAAREPLKPSVPLAASASAPSSTTPSQPASPTPSQPASQSAAAPASSSVATTRDAAPAVDATPTDLPADVAPPARTESARPVERPAAKAEAVASKAEPATKAEERAKPSGDDPRALAALEGRPLPAESGKGFAVQIAAFSSADRARGLRDQLGANGLKAYVESLSTPQGPRTRVRLGPFANREAAEHAKQKLKTMKLDGSVVSL